MNLNPGFTGLNRRHLLLMLVLCLAPIVAAAAIWGLGVPRSGVLFFGLILLCPLGHLLMMRAGQQHH